ncbi:MAG TPA: aldo/keto reductase [Deltaproteobacteria bacterium]|nr:aldo/keto reductase [Deltaproteobacteria bacterium]
MEHAVLGRTGVKISRLCFGTMSFGGDADASTSARLYAMCRDSGINTFDCADVYCGGESERLLGQLIADHRDEIVLTSKAYFPTSDDVNARGASRYHLVCAVEASLRRLGTDRIDVYFVHRFDDLTDLSETLRTLDDLVHQGKILYPALSNFAAWQAMKAVGLCDAQGWARPVCLQPMYNLVKRQAEVEILPMARAEGLAVLPYSPLGGGLLAGRYSTTERPGDGRLVQTPMYQIRYGDPRNYEIAEAFVALARQLGHPPAALAVAWVASHPAVTAPILGARSPEQLAGALPAAQIALTPEQRAQISALSVAPAPATDRNEERTAHNYGAR